MRAYKLIVLSKLGKRNLEYISKDWKWIREMYDIYSRQDKRYEVMIEEVRL